MLPVFRFLQLLCENRNRDLQNLVLELKNNASKLLLAVMESRILYNMNPRQLVDVAWWTCLVTHPFFFSVLIR